MAVVVAAAAATGNSRSTSSRSSAAVVRRISISLPARSHVRFASPQHPARRLRRLHRPAYRRPRELSITSASARVTCAARICSGGGWRQWRRRIEIRRATATPPSNYMRARGQRKRARTRRENALYSHSFSLYLYTLLHVCGCVCAEQDSLLHKDTPSKGHLWMIKSIEA